MDEQRADRIDALMRADDERWARIESAKTPEELARALRDEPGADVPAKQPEAAPPPPGQRAFSFTPTIVMIGFGVAVILAWSFWIQSVLPDAP